MYPTLLVFHSIIRWLVLASLIFAIYKAYQGWLRGKSFTKKDHQIRIITIAIAHTQLLIGMLLYWLSPIVKYLLSDFKAAISNMDSRFFGMEHSVMMLFAVILMSIGSVLAKKWTEDKSKFKALAIWFSIALLIILISIPWSFLPFSPDRPYFRGF